jgi:hypothetical protein
MIMRYKLALTAVFGLALAFTFSCSSGDDENNNGGGGSPVTGGADGGGNQFSQIYNKDGTAYNGSGVIKILAYGEDDNEILINAGSVTNGIVNLNLPSAIPDEYLQVLLDDNSQRFCSKYPEGDIKVFSDFDFALTTNDNGDYISKLRLRIRYRDEQLTEDIQYTYFTKTGKIACNIELERPDGSKTNMIMNADAKVGWNKTYCRSSSSTVECSTNNILTKEMKWVIE